MSKKHQRAILNFAELEPDPDIYVDKDGIEYEFRAATAFSAEEVARLTRLKDQGGRLRKLLRDRNKKQLAQKQIDRISTEITAIILPGLSSERIAQLTEGERGLIYDFWQAQQDARREKATFLPEGEDEPDAEGEA